MASSYAEQIPVIVHLLQQLRPRSLLDVGKGFGKYGFLAHEYAGIPTDRQPDPTRSLAEQSALTIDAVEVQEKFLWPHLGQLYRKMYVGPVESLYAELPAYDVVLMCDVIEHLEKTDAERVIQRFLGLGSRMIVATPRHFFHQHLFESPHEEHVSHWRPRDFRFVPFMDYQNCGPGRVFLLAPGPTRIRGFGNSPLTKARRLARLVLAEL